mgnify:CR=1 FL=1
MHFLVGLDMHIINNATLITIKSNVFNISILLVGSLINPNTSILTIFKAFVWITNKFYYISETRNASLYFVFRFFSEILHGFHAK